jgi:chromosome partitioning protein
MERLLTTQEVADRLAVDKKTVLRYMRAGKLTGSRIGRDYRIPEGSVVALLRRTNPAAPVDRSAVVTAVVNQKGGVGKTTTTFNLGVGLQRRGKRVLLIDLDPQAALSASTGVPIAQLTASVYQALLDENVDPIPIIRETVSGVDILPATIDLAAAEVELVSMTLRELVLRDVVAKLRPRYDHILIDCPPSLGLLTINALAAADRVIIPLQCEYLATRGLTLLLKTLEKVQARLNRELRIEGILPTMFDGRTTHANEILSELRANFPGQVFETVIKDAVRVKESPAAGLSIFDYDPNHDVAKAYVRLAQEVDHA